MNSYNRMNLRGPCVKTDGLLYGSTQSLTRMLKFLTRYITVFFSGLALWQDGGPNCREDAYGQPRLRPEDAVPLHSWGSGHAVPLQVPLRELLVHQVSSVLHVTFLGPNGPSVFFRRFFGNSKQIIAEILS